LIPGSVVFISKIKGKIYLFKGDLMNNRGVLLTFLRLSTVLFLLASFSLVPGTRAADLVIYVDADATGANDGTSWADAYPDLQDALAAAEATDEIWVAEGTYLPDAADQTVSFALVDGVAVYGGFSGVEVAREERNSDPATNNTVLSGEIGDPGLLSDNSDSVVTSDQVGSTTILDGFTITGGVADGQRGLPHPDRSGAGMHNDSGSPTLANLIFEDNQAEWAGGMFNNKSTPTLTNVLFTANTASNSGGGLYNKSSDAVLNEVQFEGNQAGDGGGMYNDASAPVLTNVDFSFNTASGDGGGMYNNGGSDATLVNVTFQGDAAASGGGIYNNASSPTMTNGTFVGETATASGGALYNLDSSPVLTNVSLSGSVAANLGGGMYNQDSDPTMGNAILWVNEDSSGSGLAAQIYNAGTSTPTISFSLVGDTDPLFVRDADDGGDGWDPGDDYGNLWLRAESPAINAGDNSLVPAGITFDLDNNPRIVGGTVDMGAYEAFNVPPVAADDFYDATEDTQLDIPAPGVLDNDTDPNGDDVSITGYTQPVNGSLTLDTDGSFSYMPTADFFGTDTFTYTLSDDGTPSLWDTATVTITVAAGTENDPPVAEDDAYDASEDTQLDVAAPGVLDNDSDPDGDALAVSDYTQPANGSLTMATDGSFSYMPALDFFGTDTFTYTLSDDGTPSLWDTATVTITVAAGTGNEAPLAEDDAYDAFEDTQLDVAAPGVLDNDGDPDGDDVSISEYTQPGHGSLTLDADGSFSYMPEAHFSGVDTFTYTLCDDGTPMLCDTATVTITVANVTFEIHLPMMFRQ
jgi:hypothetical protein